MLHCKKKKETTYIPKKKIVKDEINYKNALELSHRYLEMHWICLSMYFMHTYYYISTFIVVSALASAAVIFQYSGEYCLRRGTCERDHLVENKLGILNRIKTRISG